MSPTLKQAFSWILLAVSNSSGLQETIIWAIIIVSL